MREYGFSACKRVEMRKRILVVDDDRALRSLIQDLLEDESYEVDTAIDGVDALEQLDHPWNVYDVILLDLTMPRLNGLQFLQKVQAQGWPRLRSIIALSGDEEALQQAACIGIGNALKKPFDLEVLLALIVRTMYWREEKSIA
jgi:CheY-like chemotaxis protein